MALTLNLAALIEDAVHSPKVSGYPLYPHGANSKVTSAAYSDPKWRNRVKREYNSPTNIQCICITFAGVYISYWRAPAGTNSVWRAVRWRDILSSDKSDALSAIYLSHGYPDNGNFRAADGKDVQARITHLDSLLKFLNGSSYALQNLEELWFDNFIVRGRLGNLHGDNPNSKQLAQLIQQLSGMSIADLSAKMPLLSNLGYSPNLFHVLASYDRRKLFRSEKYTGRIALSKDSERLETLTGITGGIARLSGSPAYSKFSLGDYLFDEQRLVEVKRLLAARDVRTMPAAKPLVRNDEYSEFRHLLEDNKQILKAGFASFFDNGTVLKQKVITAAQGQDASGFLTLANVNALKSVNEVIGADTGSAALAIVSCLLESSLIGSAAKTPPNPAFIDIIARSANSAAETSTAENPHVSVEAEDANLEINEAERGRLLQSQLESNARANLVMEQYIKTQEDARLNPLLHVIHSMEEEGMAKNQIIDVLRIHAANTGHEFFSEQVPLLPNDMLLLYKPALSEFCKENA